MGVTTQWTILMDNASLAALREEELDMVSAGQALHFGKLQFGNHVLQTNTAVQIGVAIGGSIVQVINQSNVVL
jgi:hypothetical protein